MDAGVTPAMLREQVFAIVAGTAFVAAGAAACAVAAIRYRSGGRVFLWLGVWCGIYGTQELTRTPAFAAALPLPVGAGLPLLTVSTSYFILVAGLLVWWELTRGLLKRVLAAFAAAALAVAAAGVGVYLSGGDAGALQSLNALLGVAALLILLAVTALPVRLAGRYLVRPQRGVLLAGTLVFALQALYSNVARTLGLSSPRALDWVGFAALILAFGYVALRAVIEREHRLVSIESELAVARRLQQSILPAEPPQLTGVRIAAAYEPMTAVAGDFYEFLPVDSHRAGFLVADVSGHGVPAALVASIVKVAVQSVANCTDDPGELISP